MRHRVFFVVPVLLLTLAACGGEPVALNERLFVAESMESIGRGCYLYELGGDAAHVGSGGHSLMGRFGVTAELDDDVVVVSVKDGAQTIIQRRYGESFFKSGSLDQFMVGPAFGNDSVLLRYWGTFRPNGADGCAPLEDDEPRR